MFRYKMKRIILAISLICLLVGGSPAGATHSPYTIFWSIMGGVAVLQHEKLVLFIDGSTGIVQGPHGGELGKLTAKQLLELNKDWKLFMSNEKSLERRRANHD